MLQRIKGRRKILSGSAGDLLDNVMAGKRITLGYRMIETLNRKFDEFDKDKNGVLSLDEILAMSDTGDSV